MAGELIRRSLYFVAPGAVEIREEPLPALAPHRLLLQTRISAISAGTETLILRGEAPAGLAVDETIASLGGGLDFPLKYGYAAVGEVIAAGADLDPGWVGRRAFAFNPHETHFQAAPGDLLPLPATISDEQAAFIPNLETALNLLHDGAPRLGERVAVFGLGIVGLLTCALLARLPLECLVGLDPIRARREMAETLAGLRAVDPADLQAFKAIESAPSDRPGPAGFDLIYELSGAPQALEQALALAGFHSRIVIGSWYGRKPVSLDLGGRFHRDRVRLISSQVSTIDPELSGRWDKKRRLAAVLDLLPIVDPTRFISQRLPFDRAQEAYTLLLDQPQRALQIVLTYGD